MCRDNSLEDKDYDEVCWAYNKLQDQELEDTTIVLRHEPLAVLADNMERD